ncbi:hypothetical protein [Inhella gelatinilytica]|uniref:Uncharacterized protein n=1 Tax=Inhella gelatinilytica TaxID=2795030 RepID=A0A931IUU5_9BURK|nr:hypothetical protein [Inhella gelatinilytica]MBH9553192.1 hypothetical protein [Inhella gelatinilytica]
MASYSVEFERLWAQRAKDLGRDLTPDETKRLDGELFQAWIDAGRLDELIRTILANFGRDGGLIEIVELGHHLRETRDRARIDTLFRGLISRRVKAFHDWWPRAEEGHIGCMQAAARASAEAMDVYLEYFHSLDTLGLEAERDAVRAEALRFQQRLAPKHVLPKMPKKSTD